MIVLVSPVKTLAENQSLHRSDGGGNGSGYCFLLALNTQFSPIPHSNRLQDQDRRAGI